MNRLRRDHWLTTQRNVYFSPEETSPIPTDGRPKKVDVLEQIGRWLAAPLDQLAEPLVNEAALLAAGPRCQPVKYEGSLMGRVLGGPNFGASVSQRPSEIESALVLSGLGAPPTAGQLFARLDERGRIGVFRTTSEEVAVDCFDSCPDWWHGAEWDQSPGEHASGNSIIVGPLDNPRSNARILTPEMSGESYTLIDLDGDGKPDLRSSNYFCGCQHWAHETLVRSGEGWRVTERNVRWILPPTDFCK